MDEDGPAGPTLRIDSAFDEAGGEVSQHYDPMIAKLIVHAPSRADAAGALADHCREVEVWPIRTNAAFLARCLDHARFLKGDVDTGFIAAEEDALLAPAPLDDAGALAAAAVLAREAAARSNRETGPTPWAAARALAGFRLNAPAGYPVALHTAGQGRVLRLTRIGDEAFEADLDGGRAAMALWPGPGPHQDWYRPQVRFDDDRDPVPYDYLADEHAVVVYRDGRAYRVDGRTSRGAAAGWWKPSAPPSVSRWWTAPCWPPSIRR